MYSECVLVCVRTRFPRGANAFACNKTPHTLCLMGIYTVYVLNSVHALQRKYIHVCTCMHTTCTTCTRMWHTCVSKVAGERQNIKYSHTASIDTPSHLLLSEMEHCSCTATFASSHYATQFPAWKTNFLLPQLSLNVALNTVLLCINWMFIHVHVYTCTYTSDMYIYVCIIGMYTCTMWLTRFVCKRLTCLLYYFSD